MIGKEMVIVNKTGLHARPASIFVKAAGMFLSSVTIESRNEQIDAKSILAVLSAAISKGERIMLIVDGPDEKEALLELSGLIESGFEEE
jgi:phosphocarrier protein